MKTDQVSSGSSNWLDVSGEENHALANSPIIVEETGHHPSIFLHGDSYFEIPYNLDSLIQLTCLAVFKVDNTQENIIWSSNGTMEKKITVSTLKAMGPDSIYDTHSIPMGYVTSSTVIQRWEPSSETATSASIYIGKTNIPNASSKNFKGHIFEFILFDEALTFLERMQLETYLSIKYGITKRLGNYVSSGEKVLWEQKKLEDFNNRIIGVGRDDEYGLYQKQSVSANDTAQFMTFSVGPVASSNQQNSSIIVDEHFILIGDNGGPLSMAISDEDTKLPIMARKWITVPTGESALSLNTTLQFDMAMLPFDSSGYWLAIDTYGTDFHVDNLTFYSPDSISMDSIAYFHNISWDSDHSFSDGFTFAQYQPLFAQVKDIIKPVCTETATGEVTFEIVEGNGPYRYRVLGSNDYDHYFDGSTTARETGLKAGQYELYITDSNGNSFSRTFTIDVADAIEVNIPEVEMTFLRDSSLVLDAFNYILNQDWVSVEWSNNFGFRSNNPKIMVMESGIYTLSVTNTAGCVFSDEVIISGSPFQKVAVYPTITESGYFNVNISLDHIDDVRLRVYDLQTRLKSELTMTGSSEYRTEGFLQGAGMFLVVMETPEGVITQKVIRR
ncbi:MAG: hypothetical protein RIA62_09910 [Cyclobacteriaceae bacterium]